MFPDDKMRALTYLGCMRACLSHLREFRVDTKCQYNLWIQPQSHYRQRPCVSLTPLRSQQDSMQFNIEFRLQINAFSCRNSTFSTYI